MPKFGYPDIYGYQALLDKQHDSKGELLNKLGCMIKMVVNSILPHAECGRNDHRKDAFSYILIAWGVAELK